MKEAGTGLKTGEKRNALEKRIQLKEHSSTPVLRVEVSSMPTSTTRPRGCSKDVGKDVFRFISDLRCR